MAIRAVLVDLMRLERTTSSLQGTLSPIEIQTLIWWARLVSIQLLPKETGLQPAAVADLLLTHIMTQNTGNDPDTLRYALLSR